MVRAPKSPRNIAIIEPTKNPNRIDMINRIVGMELLGG
jgi:hypothetical protein